MRKQNFSFVLLFLCMLGIGSVASAQEQTVSVVTSKSVGDSIFLSTNYGVNLFVDWGDGTYEMTKSLSQTIGGKLKGSEVMIKGSGLSYLDLEGNALDSIDVSKAPLLQTLLCGNNNLVEIDLTANVNLMKLGLENNKLTTVNFGKCTKLVELNVAGNQFTALNLILNKNLEALICGYNQLAALSLTQNTKLKTLWCQQNALTGTLDMTRSKSLTSLICYNNQIETLNLAGVNTLVDVWCENNKIGYINLSGCTALETLSCDYNQLDSLSFAEAIRPKSVYCNNNRLCFSSILGPTYVKPNYRYTPQDEVAVAPSQVLVGDIVDLRKEVYSASATNLSTQFVWKDINGKTLVRNTDYSEAQKGYFAFKKEYRGVYCTMKANALTYIAVTAPFDVVSTIVKLGDANGDGAINVADIVAITNYIVGEPNESFIPSVANINGDNIINVTDAVLLIHMILGESDVKLITIPGYEE